MSPTRGRVTAPSMRAVLVTLLAGVALAAGTPSLPAAATTSAAAPVATSAPGPVGPLLPSPPCPHWPPCTGPMPPSPVPWPRSTARRTRSPTRPPGSIIRSQAIPSGAGVPAGTRAYRVLFHTTSDSGGDLAESGVIVVPGGTPPPGGFPIVSWAHGTTGVASGCAPSLDGTSTIPDLPALLAGGDIVVAADYRGLGAPGLHPYLVGDSEAEDVLDGARAARSLVGDAASNPWSCSGSRRVARPPSSPGRSPSPTPPSSSSPAWPPWPR